MLPAWAWVSCDHQGSDRVRGCRPLVRRYPCSRGTAEKGGGYLGQLTSDSELFPDTTDFQESFVTSGVFSVTELIQVSRSECPRPQPLHFQGWVGHMGPRGSALPIMGSISFSSTCGDWNRTQLLPGRAAGPPGIRPEPGQRWYEKDSTQHLLQWVGAKVTPLGTSGSQLSHCPLPFSL